MAKKAPAKAIQTRPVAQHRTEVVPVTPSRPQALATVPPAQAPDSAFLFEQVSQEMAVRAPPTEKLAALAEQVNAAIQIKKDVAELEAMLSTMKKSLEDYEKKLIPDAIRGAGLKNFTTIAGDKAEIKTFFSGSLPKDDEPRKKAFEFINKNGGSDIVKCFIELTLPKGYRESNSIADALAKAKRAFAEVDLELIEEIDVHPQTLYSWVRQRIEDGQEPGLDILGVFTGSNAKITLAGDEKPKRGRKADA